MSQKPIDEATVRARLANTFANFEMMEREQLIEFLTWHDPNGCYTDKECQKELGEVLSTPKLRHLVRSARPETSVVPEGREFRVYSKLIWGKAKIYAANEVAEKAATKAKRATLDVGHLEAAVKEGFTVVHVGRFADIWVERAFGRYCNNGSFA